MTKEKKPFYKRWYMIVIYIIIGIGLIGSLMEEEATTIPKEETSPEQQPTAPKEEATPEPKTTPEPQPEVAKAYKEIARFEGSSSKSTESFKVNSDKIKIVANAGGSIVGSITFISLKSEDGTYDSFLRGGAFTLTAEGEKGVEGETIIRNLKPGDYYLTVNTGVKWEAIVYEYS